MSEIFVMVRISTWSVCPDESEGSSSEGKGHAGHGGHHIHMVLRNLNPKPQMKGESRSKTHITSQLNRQQFVVMLTLTPLNLLKNVK